MDKTHKKESGPIPHSNNINVIGRENLEEKNIETHENQENLNIFIHYKYYL